MRLSTPISAIGFDVDNTLTRQQGRISSAIVEKSEAQIHDAMVFSIRCYDVVKRTYQDLGLNKMVWNGFLVRMRNHIRDQSVGITREAHEMLDDVSSRGIPLYVVSNAPGELWGQRLLAKRRENFGVMLFSEDTSARKADPSGILKALDTMHISSPKETLYVGNSASDMRAAIAADVTPVAIGGNTSAAEYLRRAAASETLRRGIITANWGNFREGLSDNFEGQTFGYEP